MVRESTDKLALAGQYNRLAGKAAGAGLIVASGLYILMRERLGASRTRPVTGSRISAEAVTAPRWSLLQRLLRDRG